MNIADEKWENIAGYPNYMISSESRVMNKKTLKMIAPAYNKRHKHRAVRLWSHGKTQILKIYRLKAIAFIPNPENKREVNHLDGNRMNEDLTNLQWATPKENMKHSFDTGLCRGHYLKGFEHKQAKLSEQDIILIRRWYASGFWDYTKIGKVFGITWEHANRVAKYKQCKYVVTE
jgi:hypothetical protein